MAPPISRQLKALGGHFRHLDVDHGVGQINAQSANVLIVIRSLQSASISTTLLLTLLLMLVYTIQSGMTALTVNRSLLTASRVICSILIVICSFLILTCSFLIVTYTAKDVLIAICSFLSVVNLSHG